VLLSVAPGEFGIMDNQVEGTKISNLESKILEGRNSLSADRLNMSSGELMNMYDGRKGDASLYTYLSEGGRLLHLCFHG
jgi:hypothetical protein